jgi:hypothetical protein
VLSSMFAVWQCGVGNDGASLAPVKIEGVKIEGVKIEGVKIEGDLPPGASRARRWRTSERQVATIGVEQKQCGARDDYCCDDAQCDARPVGQKRPVDEKPEDSPECRHRLGVTRAFL